MAIALGGLSITSILGATTAQAAAWKQDKPGVDTVAAFTEANPSSKGKVVASTSSMTDAAVPNVDTTALYGQDGGGIEAIVGNIAIVNTATGGRTQQFATGAKPSAVEQPALAVDSGKGAGQEGFYTWYRGPYVNKVAPAGSFPLWFYQPGATTPSQVYYLPDVECFTSNASGFGTLTGGSAVNQVTGQVYLKLGFNEYLGANSKLRLMVFDPKTLATAWSGQLKPATPSDDLWTSTTRQAGDPGYVSPGLAITASGDFLFLVTGTDKTIAANDPINVTGKTIAPGNSVSFLLKVHPSFGNADWTYSIVKMVTQDPADKSGKTLDTTQWGLSFSEGMLYLEVGQSLLSIDPVTGYWKYVAEVVSGPSTPAPQRGMFFALASAQTAASITGHVYAGTPGVFSNSDATVAGVTVALYQQTAGDAQPKLIGSQTTNGLGEYSFVTRDSAENGSVKYFVQVVQPSLNGKPAQITAGKATSTTALKVENSSALICQDGTINNASGACSGGATSRALGAIGSSVDLTSLGAYGQVTMRNAWSDPSIDFTLASLSGGPNADLSALTVDQASQQVGKAITATATIVDDEGTALPGVEVSFTATGSATPSSNSCVTNATGTCSITVTSQEIGTATIAATIVIDGDDTEIAGSPAQLQFIVGAPKPGPFYCDNGAEGTGVYPGNQSVSVDNQAGVYGLVTDEFCHPVPGVAVTLTFSSPNGTATLSSSDAGAVVSGLTLTGVTDQAGRVTVLVGDTKKELVGANGTFNWDGQDWVMGTASVTFTVGAPVPGPLTCDDGSQGTNLSVTSPADIAEPTTVTALVTDQYCQPVPGVAVDFAVTGSTDNTAILDNLSGQPAGTTDENGIVTVNLIDPVAETVTVTATMAVGEVGQAEVQFVDNKKTPSKQTIEPPVITSPEQGEQVKENPVHVTGTGVPGTTVTVDDGHGHICTGVVDEFGKWICDLALEDGDHTLSAVVTDEDGISSEAAEVSFTVDTAAEEGPAEAGKPSIPVVDPTNGSQVTGTTDPETTVTVVDEAGNQVDGCVDVAPDAQGNWACTPITPLVPGTDITVTATDEDGNKSDPVTATVLALAIAVANPVVHVGDPQTVTGYHFNPGERVHLTLHSDELDGGYATANADGVVAFEFDVPAQLDLGTHQAVLTGDVSGSISGTFDVVAQNGGGQNGSPKANTGGAPVGMPFGLAGAIVLMFGCGLALLVWRRRQSADQAK